MVTARKFGVLLLVLGISFALTTYWTVPASANTGKAKQTNSRVVKPHLVAKAKHTAVRVKYPARVQNPVAGQAQPLNTGVAAAARCYYPCYPYGNTANYNWNVPAGAGSGNGQSAGVSTQHQAPYGSTTAPPATASQTQPGGPAAQTYCSTWVPCWTAPVYTWTEPAYTANTPAYNWNAPATYGGSAQSQAAPALPVAPQTGTTTAPQNPPATAAANQVPFCYNGWVQYWNGPMYWTSCATAPACY